MHTTRMKKDPTMIGLVSFFGLLLLLLLVAVVPCGATVATPPKETTSTAFIDMNEQDKANRNDFNPTQTLEQAVEAEAPTPRMLQTATTANATNTTTPVATNTTTAPTTAAPTESPAPSPSPSDMPTSLPTLTAKPTHPPTIAPTESPAPSPSPSDSPTLTPSSFPSISPTLEPSVSSQPSVSPTISVQPSVSPSYRPSNRPSVLPSVSPSMRPSLVTETSDSFTVQLELDIFLVGNATKLNSTQVQAFEQATADWMDTVVLKDGSLSMVEVTVTGQEIQPVGAATTTTAAATESSNVNGGGGNGKQHYRNLQEQQPQQVYWVIDMDVIATYSGPDADFDLYKALDPLIQANDDDWMRNLANAAPVFESLRPASMAAIFGDDQAMTVSSGMSTAGYVAVIIVSVMALTLGVAASVFVVKAHQRYGGDLMSASGKSWPSPVPSYNMSMEEYPLNGHDKPTMPVPPVSEQSENSPLRGAEVAPSPSSCCSSEALDYLGCGGTMQDEGDDEEDREVENKPPMSPNTMEKGRDNHNKVAGDNNRAAPAAGGINLFDGIQFRKPPMPDDDSRQDPPTFSEVDFGNDHRSLFDPVAKKSLLLASGNNTHHHHVPPSSILHNHPRDPSDRGIGSSMLHRHPDPASSSRFEPMVMDKMSEASSSWYDNHRPSAGTESRVSSNIAARIAQFEKNSDPGSGVEGGRELRLTKSSGGTLGATAVDRSAAGTGSDLSSHARDFFSSILGGGPNNNDNDVKPALGSDAQQSNGSKSNSNTSSVLRKQGPPVHPSSSLHQRKPSYESLLRRGGAGLYDVFAPAGPIGIVVDTTSNGPAVHSLRNTSPMVGLISPGDLIVGLDDEDTRSMTAATLTRRMAQKANQKERKITLLTLDGGY